MIGERRLKMNRKGLSDVVTTVLIILLVIAAIAIIWGFIGPTLNNAGVNVRIQALCSTITAKATACTAGNYTDNMGTADPADDVLRPQATISYEYSGATAGDVSAVSLIATFADGITELKSDSSPSAIESGVVIYNSTTVAGVVNKARTATAQVVLNKPDGSTYSCTPSPVTVLCA